MKWIKLFENYSNIDVDYIKELIEDFCLDNDIFYDKDFYKDIDYDTVDEKEESLISNNIKDRNILICNIQEKGITMNLFLYSGGDSNGKYHVGLEFLKNKYPKIKEDIEKLNILINKSLNKDGFKTSINSFVLESNIYDLYVDEHTCYYFVNNQIIYKK